MSFERIGVTLHRKFASSVFLAASLLCCPIAHSQSTKTATDAALDLPTVLYGAAYYNEYMPGDQDARLDKDVALMKAAGLNVCLLYTSPSPRDRQKSRM